MHICLNNYLGSKGNIRRHKHPILYLPSAIGDDFPCLDDHVRSFRGGVSNLVGKVYRASNHLLVRGEGGIVG